MLTVAVAWSSDNDSAISYVLRFSGWHNVCW